MLERILRAYAGDVRQWCDTVRTQALDNRIRSVGCNFTAICVQVQFSPDQATEDGEPQNIANAVQQMRRVRQLGIPVFPGVTVSANGGPIDYTSRAHWRARGIYCRQFLAAMMAYNELVPQGLWLDVEAYSPASLPNVVSTTTWDMNSLGPLLAMIRAATGFREALGPAPPLWVMPVTISSNIGSFEYWPLAGSLGPQFVCENSALTVSDHFRDETVWDAPTENGWRDYYALPRTQLPDAAPLYRQPQPPLAAALEAEWVGGLRVDMLRNENAAKLALYDAFTGPRQKVWVEMSGSNRTHWISNPTSYMPA